MQEITASPIVVPLLFLLRCVLPTLLMLAISYLLRKGGWIIGSNEKVENSSGGSTSSGGSPHV